MPAVSVVIPCFNAAAYVDRAIRSVQEQTLADTEILVVDDASTDGTAARIERIAQRDSRVVLQALNRNVGPGPARNHGFARALGRWIAVLDADDAFLPSRLQRLVDLGDQTGADVVSDNLLLWREGELTTECSMFATDQLASVRLMTPAAFVEGNIVQRNHKRVSYGFMKPLFRRDFTAAHRLEYEAISFSEDYLFALRHLVRGARWTVDPEPSYRYTVRQQSLTSNFAVRDLQELAAAERRLLSDEIDLCDATLRRWIRRHIRSVDNAAAWQAFVESIKRRRPDQALTHLMTQPASLPHILKETVMAMPKVVGRLLST